MSEEVEETPEVEENNEQRAAIEEALLNAWVGGEVSFLDPYHRMTTDADPYYFRWAESPDGAIVFFKPRMISMKILTHWLNMKGVVDVQLHRQSMFAANMMGAKADLQEIAILFEKA